MDNKQLRNYALEKFIDLRKVATNDEQTHGYLKSGYLRKLSPAFAIYRPDHEVLNYSDRVRLKLLAHSMGFESSILVLNSAATWHGLWTTGDDTVEVTTSVGNQPPKTRWYGRRFYSMMLRQEHWGTYYGVVCTSPARTCIDIARLHGFKAGLIALDSYLAQGRNKYQLEKTLAGLVKLKGLPVARRCFGLATAASGSAWESSVRADLLETGIPMKIELQKKILNYYADICIDGWLVIEVDGNVKYDGTYGDPTSAIVNERRREKEITNAGYRVLRFSPDQLRNPELLINAVRSELELGPLRGMPAA